MTGRISSILFTVAGTLTLLFGVQSTLRAQMPEPFWFDFWNLSGTKSIISDPWKLIEDPPNWLPATPERWPGFRTADPAYFGELLKKLSGAENEGQTASVETELAALRRDSGRLQASREARLDVLHSRAKIELPDPEYLRWNPHSARNWKAEEELKFPIPAADGFFLFGSLDGAGDSFDNQSMTMVGMTGVGVKFSPLPRSEVQLRGGRLVTYTDPYSSTRYLERSQVMVELLAKAPLFGPWQLQYKGSAMPALLPSDRDQLRQDLKIALPLRNSSEFHLGARYRWEYSPTPSPWMERASLYLGIELKH